MPEHRSIWNQDRRGRQRGLTALPDSGIHVVRTNRGERTAAAGHSSSANKP
ncbi:hypothetical protein L842_5796 [Mycobacterium intracellulare MIN_052511_1280]|nr:hypothetical protein L842_5796 [Mycobacterium intracellulare MIN_052511_1280]